MSKNEEGLSLIEDGALLVEHDVPNRGTFTRIMFDAMCFEVTESGRTLVMPVMGMFWWVVTHWQVASWRMRFLSIWRGSS